MGRVVRIVPRALMPLHLPCGCRVKRVRNQKVKIDVFFLSQSTVVCAHGRKWAFVIGVHEIGLRPETVQRV